GRGRGARGGGFGAPVRRPPGPAGGAGPPRRCAPGTARAPGTGRDSATAEKACHPPTRTPVIATSSPPARCPPVGATTSSGLGERRRAAVALGVDRPDAEHDVVLDQVDGDRGDVADRDDPGP